MTPIKLIPIVTADGRHIILQAIPLTPRERVRRLAERLRPGRVRKSR